MAGLRRVELQMVKSSACALLGAVLALAPLQAGPAAAQAPATQTPSAQAPSAQAPSAQAPAGQAPAAQKPADGALTPPPVVDPKKVETTPVAPAPRALAPQEVTLAPVPVLTLAGSATWEEAYEKLVAAVKQANEELKRLGLARAGDTFVAYTSSDDLGFEYEVQVPFSGATTQKPSGEMKLGGSYAGKVLKFTHAGSFADMDNTYEQIANYLDEKNVDAGNLYIEQYRTDIVTGAPEALEIDILVPLP